MLSYSTRRAMARRNAAAVRRYDAEAKAHLAQIAADRDARAAEAHAARVAADQADAASAAPLIDTIEPGDMVREPFGWHPVVKVSAKSVTVQTAWSWTERIARSKVLEVHKVVR